MNLKILLKKITRSSISIFIRNNLNLSPVDIDIDFLNKKTSISDAFCWRTDNGYETKFLNYKIQAIKCYKDELKKYPHSRSLIGVKNLNKMRGNQSGLNYAEAYEIIRKIEK